jgi:hypothetical protein
VVINTIIVPNVIIHYNTVIKKQPGGYSVDYCTVSYNTGKTPGIENRSRNISLSISPDLFFGRGPDKYICLGIL